MPSLRATKRAFYVLSVVMACAVTSSILILSSAAQGRQAKTEMLMIGATAAGPESTDKKKNDAAIESLKGFIKDETGFNNEILHIKDWRELASKMAKKEIQLGVFQGYEFAWATAKTPELQPLALAVNVHVYPVASVVVNKSSAVKAFSDLQGQSVAIPNTGQLFLKVYVDKQCLDLGKPTDKFFSKITQPTNTEDALDDVVDGPLQAAVADQAALESFKRRKPGRFSQLKEIAHSPSFPPPVVAYYKGVVDDKTLARFQDGLLEARKKEMGQTMLTLFKLTGFEKIPADFEKVLVATRKNYPAPVQTAK